HSGQGRSVTQVQSLVSGVIGMLPAYESAAACCEGCDCCDKDGPTASTDWDSGMPEPSRRPCSVGNAREAPLEELAFAGPWPAQASVSTSSPFRKRCARTPPVARPFAGYSSNGVTLTDPGEVPGRASCVDATVTTTVAASPAATEPKNATESPAASLIPATPPAVRPWARTVEAGKCSSCAWRVMKTRSSSSAGTLRPT